MKSKIKSWYENAMMFFFLLLVNVPTCQTVGGKDCVLPWVYENVTYIGCITYKDPDNKPWCSTKVNKANNCRQFYANILCEYFIG